MKPALLGALVATLLTSCAFFAYGTGRLNPIFVKEEAAFNVKPNETHYLSLGLSGSRVATVMPPPTVAYPPDLVLQPYTRERGVLSGAEWRSSSVPSGWVVNLADARIGFEARSRLGAVWNERFEVFTQLGSNGADLSLSLAVPVSATAGLYTVSGRFSTRSSGVGIGVKLSVNVVGATSTTTPRSGALSANSNGRIDVVPGGAYTLEFSFAGYEVVQLTGSLANAYLETFGRNATTYSRVRGDEWRVNAENLPPRWELEWVEGNVTVNLHSNKTSLNANEVLTEYTLSYGDLRLLLGLRAIGATQAAYSLRGQLEYRAMPVQAIRWTVSVQP
jgi:hypothetical protein